MTMVHDGRDAAKASEHALVVRRGIALPPWEVRRVLPLVPARLARQIFVTTPRARLALDLEIAPVAGRSAWRIVLRQKADPDAAPFLDGEMHLEDLWPASTQVVLSGKLSGLSPDLAVELSQASMRDLVEENVIRTFERILTETVAASVAS